MFDKFELAGRALVFSAAHFTRTRRTRGMRQSRDCKAVDALRRKAAATRSLGWPGYCGSTGSGEAGCSDRRRQGTWEGTRQLQHCLDRCKNCSRCHYVSFSAVHGDCSWFRTCSTDKLATTLSRAHTTYRVRTPNGALTPLDVGVPEPSIDAQIKQLRCVDDWFERPRRVFFHDRSTLEQYAQAELPNFRRSPFAPSRLREWARLGRSRAPPIPRWGTCAVVGSAPSILERRDGRAIDAHDAVIRVNGAPTGPRYQRHVGLRTTMRVWGSLPLPERHRYRNETLVIYCPPVRWVGECWTAIASTAQWPRLGAMEWSLVSQAVHGSAPTLRFPSTGTMAVWAALALCERPTLFGFGGCADNASAAAIDAYYHKGDAERQSQYDYHDMPREWGWLRELERMRIVDRVGC